jgi:hypothetical protein
LIQDVRPVVDRQRKRAAGFLIYGGCLAAYGYFFGFVATAHAEGFRLKLPIVCEVGRSCFIQNYVDAESSPAAKDYRCGTLTYDNHNGTDFRLSSRAAQRAGVDVIAAAEGRVVAVRDGQPDVSVRDSGKDAIRGVECGNGVRIAHSEGFETQYCHLARGSVRVQPGQDVGAGHPLGRVGLSGLTEYPHLHFTVRREGRVVDPFAYGASPGTCGEGEWLWEQSLHTQLTYRQRAVLNAGFTSGAVTMESIESGDVEKTSPTADAPAIVAFVRAIGLKAGDVQSLSVRDPAGSITAENRAQPLQKDMAQVMLFAGRKRPSESWGRGVYRARYIVERDGQIVLERELELDVR